MSRDPLEGVRPSDLAGPPHSLPAPAHGGVVASSKPAARPALMVFVVVGTVLIFGIAAGVLAFVQSSPPSAKPGVVDQTAAKQLPRHSPDGAPLTPPANDMTTIAPKAEP